MAAIKMHWTDNSINDFAYRIASDFIVQLEKKIESEGGLTRVKLATRFGVSPGRVSQVLNNPGNLTLKSTVRCARALGMKVVLVAYDDKDASNENGPVNSEIFATCWKNAGEPRDFFELAATTQFYQLAYRNEVFGTTDNIVLPGSWPTMTASTNKPLAISAAAGRMN
jgi:DNA-binding phage protein